MFGIVFTSILYISKCLFWRFIFDFIFILAIYVLKFSFSR